MSSRSAEQQPLLPSDHHHDSTNNSNTTISTTRRQTKRFLTSKTGHYAVLALVSLDITSIFADLLITSLACEGHIPSIDAAQASEVLGVVSLVFSSLFVVELAASVWAFGWAFFHSWFHCMDATVILAGFTIDVLLRGTLEEIGSIVVVLRLWRVFKIIEELSAGAQEQMEPLMERIADLEKLNSEYRREVEDLKSRAIGEE